VAIVVLQHSDDCRPGRLGLTLRDHGFRLDILRVDRGDPIPADFDDVHAVISLGGPQFVTDSHAWIPRELDFLKRAHERALPVIGICLGAQMIGKALGGEVGPMDKPEIGFVDTFLSPAGQSDTILAGVSWTFPTFQHHRHEVKTLPPGAAILASSTACKAQIFRLGIRTYAFQPHIEADRAIMDDLLGPGGNELHHAGLTAADFTRQASAHMEPFSRLADRICVNIATCLIPRIASAMAR
jgi:GMP synthase (glutamine-hydrolysing)